jgi:hypothetical protein
LGKKEGISISQLINSALAEKDISHMSVEYLEEKPKRESRSKFETFPSKVKNVESEAEYQA